MPVSTLRPMKLTSQQIADFMLQSDRERRAAQRKGDYQAAASADREVVALAKLLA